MNASKFDPATPLPPAPRGRGSADNPAGRFEPLDYAPDPPEEGTEARKVSTQFFHDEARSLISYNESPDVGFEASINPYRGCEHGCVYCYARPTHEYLGLSAGLDFETKIMVKKNAPQLLRKAFSSPRYQPVPIAFSGNTDCYQPAERKLQLTRGCLEVFAEFLHPVGMITKNELVTRDIDVLAPLAKVNAAAVNLSITSLNPDLTGVMEPRTSRPERRLKAVTELSKAGIPVGLLLAPVIPGLNDEEIPRILEAAAKAGARWAGYVVLRLPHGVKDLFEAWLTRHFPAKKDKVLNRIRAVRGGNLYDPAFGSRMRGEGIFAEQIKKLFEVGCRKAGLNKPRAPLSSAAFRRPASPQMDLFQGVE